MTSQKVVTLPHIPINRFYLTNIGIERGFPFSACELLNSNNFHCFSLSIVEERWWFGSGEEEDCIEDEGEENVDGNENEEEDKEEDDESDNKDGEEHGGIDKKEDESNSVNDLEDEDDDEDEDMGDLPEKELPHFKL